MLPLIERLRAARAQFMLGQKTAGAMKNVAPKGEKGKLSLEDLWAMTDVLDRMMDEIGTPELPPLPVGPSPFLPGTKMQWAWDFTSLGQLKKCPRLYEYSMIRGYQGRPSFHLYFGIEFHQAMHDYENGKAEGLDHDAAELETVFKLSRSHLQLG